MANEKIIEFDLNLVPQGVPPIVHVHQYDFGTVVTLKPTLYYGKELFDGDLTSYDYIIAYARPDGSKQSYVINPMIEENTIAFPLDGAMTAVWGPNVMSIGLQNGSNNSVIWTQNFILSLERHPIQSDDYIGSSAYDGMIRTLQRYVDEAYSTTPPGYEEHIRNIEEVLDTISEMRDEIEQNYNEAKEYTDEKIGGLDSVYATLDDVTQAAQEGRDYAGTLIGDVETQIMSDMSLLYTTKEEANEQEIGMQIYAEQVTEASATELRERLGIEYTEEGIDFVENGALSAEISKKANEISQTLSAEFATKEYVDGVETETKSYAESQITQKANEITTSVRQNYESKEDASSKLAESKSYTDSSITQASGAITSAVNAYTDDTLRNLKIGAANLLRGTNEFKTEDSSQGWTPSYNNGGWEKTGTAIVSEIDDPPGSGFTNQVAMTGATLAQNDIDWFVDNKDYTAHMWIKKPIGTDPNGESYLWFRDSETGEKIFVGYTDSEGDQIPTIEYEFHNPSHEEYRDPTDINGNFVIDENDILALDGGVTKVNVEDEDSEWIELDVHFRNKDWPEKVDVVVGDGSTNFTFAGLKIEEGTKVTSWYPNEFDFENFFSTRIIQSYDSIMQSVYGAYTQDENGNDIRTKWGSLSAYVNNVAGRVTTMANAQYITQDDLFGQESAVHSVLTDEIVSAVSDHWENLDTIAAMGSDILTKSDRTTISSWARLDMKLGGPNILRATDSATELVDSTKSIWSLDGWKKASGGDATITRITAVNPPNNNITRAWRISAAATASSGSTDVAQDEVPLSYGHEYTASCYFRVISGSGKLRLQSWKAANASHVKEIDVNSSDNSGWTRAIWTFTHDFSDYKDQSNIYFGLKNTSGTECTIEICGLKLENGNMATDWQQSIYDTQAYVEAQITVATDSITGTVSTLNGRVSTVEQTAEGLTSTVSKMSVGGVNMLQDVNASSLTKVNAAHNRYFSDSNISEVTPTMVAISDPPNGVNVSYGSRFVVSAVNASRGRRLCWYSGGVVPFVDGETYTVSCYGRIVSGDTMRVSFQFGTSTYKGTTIDSISGEWARYMYSFTYNKSDYGDTNGVGTRVYIGVIAAYTGTFELCGFQCEKGTFATAFSEESVTPSNIISRINQTAESVTIDASKINFNGSTFFTNLQSNVQNAVSGSVKRIYYRTTTNSQPSAPSSGVTTGVTSTATTAGGWRTVIPDFSPGDTFYWTCEEYKKNDGKFYYTNVSPFHATIVDGANIYAGSITLTKFDSNTQNTISTASSDASTAKSDAATAKTTAENAVTRYGQCSTAAGTAAKAVTLTTGKLATLAAGAVVSVYFTNANTAATPTLNVNSTGAKQIRMVHGTAWETGSNWKAGAVLTFTYDGTYWIVTNGSQTKDAYDKANTAATNASNALTAANKAVVESVTVYYCWDHTEPTQPTDTEITSTSSAVDQWTLRMPDPVYNGYYYECTQQKLNDGTFTFTKMRRMSFTEGIAKWISTNDATKIDGGHIYTKSVDTGALNLYGLLQINQSSSGTVGGYIGYESGVTINSGGYSKTNGFRLYSSNKSHYIHTSTDGLVVHANTYLQLYNGGTQYTHMYTNAGMDFRTINDSTGDPKLISSSYDGTERKPLTVGASYLYLDADTNIIYIQDHQGVDANSSQSGLGYSSTSATGSRFVTYVISTSHDTGDLQFGCGARRARFVGPQTDPSDVRLKKDINYDGVPDYIDELNVCSFVYKDDPMERTQYGLVAQDVLRIDQNLVDYVADPLFTDKNGEVLEEDENGNGFNYYLTLNYSRFIPMLIQKCQKLQKQIDELKGESS